MLPEGNRLQRERDFSHLWRRGREIRTQGLRIRSVKTSNTKPRVGIVVSKKISKLATKRNRIRRVIKEALRPIIPSLRGERDYLIIVTPQFKEIPPKKLSAQLITLLHHHRFLK
ncbi:ribonuclease P protein component [Patescibacteria group bacterium]